MKPIFNLEYADSFAPRIKIDNEYIGIVVKSWFDSAISSEQEKVYKVVFPKGCSKNLMLHQSGEMRGLRTTSIVDDGNGKIQATAGLKEVLERNEYKLLSFALFGLVEQYLGHISRFVQELYDIKQMEIRAKFERISYVLESTYEILPELLVDKSLRAPYLNQIIDSNSNCFEMYVFFRETFKARCHKVGEQVRDDRGLSQANNRCYYLKSLLNDNVFAALERFAYGKLCEIFLSNNFTASYLNSIQKQLHSMIEELIDILCLATPWEDHFRRDWKWDIDNRQITASERDRLQSDLNDYVSMYESTFELLRSRLMINLQGVEAIAQHSQAMDIQLYIKGGELYIDQ
jgi:hypothetical protein